jgi:hypothetical protein
MATNAYAFPCEFLQQVVRIPLASTTAEQSIPITGFRSGEVKKLVVWLTDSADLGTNGGNATNTNFNPFNWQLPLSLVMSYAGDVYARYELSSHPLWNLINGLKSPAVDNALITSAAGAFTTASSPTLSYWAELPFAQTFVDEDSHHVLVHGKPITNGQVNLAITTPSAKSTWVLNISMVYNSTLLFSQGTCDYVF